MEKVETSLHEHPLIPFTRFTSSFCQRCSIDMNDYLSEDAGKCKSVYIYGGYRCNEPGCDDYVLHKECVKPLQEINHFSQVFTYTEGNHPLKLTIQDSKESSCTLCRTKFSVGYCCSVCEFKLDLVCAKIPEPLVLPENSYGHEHPLQLYRDPTGRNRGWEGCKVCHEKVYFTTLHYRCNPWCHFSIHVDCAGLFQEAYHSSHPQHSLKSLKGEVPDYADKTCILCEKAFDGRDHQLHHCDVCNFSICRACMKNPPPIDVECPTTHEHQLRLIPRRINFICNACGTQGDHSPYFCHQCNFMIHRECIGLPRIININRHDHRISYTPRLGNGEWKCRVCRKKVDGFYGAYTCVKCPTFVVHARCATNKDVWDMVEREGTPEEEEIAPFEVIDDNTIKHFSHEHNLRINTDDGKILHESVLCKACVFQICSKPFYSCEQCDFILHKKCANLPRKKRHVGSNQPFTLHTDSGVQLCEICYRVFTGFSYKAGDYTTIDVRCSLTSDSLEHGSHPHPLYYINSTRNSDKKCSHCGNEENLLFGCVECDYFLDTTCALLPKQVMRMRYDDHPLFLSFADKNVDGKYWCEACETKLDPKKWFYTCNDCGITLHISCLVGDYSYIMPGVVIYENESEEEEEDFVRRRYAEYVSNTSICRHLCSACNSRCKLPSINKLYWAGDDVYYCSDNCNTKL